MGIPNHYAFSSAGTNLSTFYRLSNRGIPSEKAGDQIGRLFATSFADGAAGTATLVLADKRGTIRYLQLDATITPTADRSDAAGTAGAYLCTVDVSATGKDKFDLMGANAELDWFIGVTDMGGLTSLDLYIDYSPAL
ncbi:MAG: hypothetical protein JKY67_00035 [Pseudomonadales bacterium]|nr:hypothetical protein [Pseudomonadales bacterium]